MYALFILLAAGCIDLGEPASDVPVEEVPGPGFYAEASALDTAAGAVTVLMEGLAFATLEVTIPAGGSVVWENNDTAFHILAEGEPGGDDPEWITDPIQFGEAFTMTFTEPGQIIYYCDNHERTMRDAIINVE